MTNREIVKGLKFLLDILPDYSLDYIEGTDDTMPLDIESILKTVIEQYESYIEY